MFLPSPILESTSEHFLSRVSRRSQGIYLLIVFSVIAGLASLPFLFVNVSVKSSGILKTKQEMASVKASANGFVSHVWVKENEAVQEGQILFSVSSPVLEEKGKFIAQKIIETEKYKQDLSLLLASKPPMHTALYKQAWADYLQKETDKKIRVEKTTLDFERSQQLYDKKVIAKTEWENTKFEWEKAKQELKIFSETQRSTWELEKRNLEKEWLDWRNQQASLQKEINLMNIVSPTKGTIQNLIGINVGSPVFANQELAVISPEGGLIAELYLSPNDIGLVQKNMKVHMQVGAFNYNQWGLLEGSVQEIAHDIQMMKDQPVFEVKCRVKQNYLSLKNGYKGYLKKGMVVQARMIVTQRSLWQLLYDRVDDWLNPNKM